LLHELAHRSELHVGQVRRSGLVAEQVERFVHEVHVLLAGSELHSVAERPLGFPGVVGKRRARFVVERRSVGIAHARVARFDPIFWSSPERQRSNGA